MAVKYIEDFEKILKQLKGTQKKEILMRFRELSRDAKITLKVQNRTKKRATARKKTTNTTQSRAVQRIKNPNERRGRPSLIPALSDELTALARKTFRSASSREAIRIGAIPYYEEMSGKTPYLTDDMWKMLEQNFLTRITDKQTAQSYRRGIATLNNLLDDSWLKTHTTTQILTAILGRERVKEYKEELKEYKVQLNKLSVGFQLSGVMAGLESEWNSNNPIVQYYLNMKQEGQDLIEEALRQQAEPFDYGDGSDPLEEAIKLDRRGRSKITRAKNQLSKQYARWHNEYSGKRGL